MSACQWSCQPGITPKKTGTLTSCLIVFFSILFTGCWEDTVNPEKKEGPKPYASEGNREGVKSGRKVLLVHSYHNEYEWVASITRGVRRALERMDADLETAKKLGISIPQEVLKTTNILVGCENGR